MRILIRILRYLGPYRGKLILAYTSLFLALAAQLTLPWVLGRAIDRGISGGDRDYLVQAVFVYLGIAVVQGVFTLGRVYLLNVLAEQVGNDMRAELFSHLQRLSFSFYDRSQTGQLMTRATEDINNVRGMLMMALRTLLLMAGTFVAVAVILLQLDWLLAVVALVVYPPLVWYSFRFGTGIRPMFARVQQQFGVMTSALQENVAGGRVVRAFAQEANENQRFQQELVELFDRNLVAASRWSRSYAGMLFGSGIGIAAVVWLGGHRVLAGEMTIGTLVAFNRYLTLLAEPIRWLGFVVNRIARAIASGERIFGTLDSKPTIADRPGATALGRATGEVRFDGVQFKFPGARFPALDDVSFVARPGETVALVGATGSGKSAVVGLIPRFYDVAAGTISVDGHDVRDLTLASLRRNVGIVMQETFLFSESIRDNIAFGRPEATDAEVEAAARAASAHPFISALPAGYATTLGERGVTLSGGQKQRLAIARALLLDAPILILDDATSSVDSRTEADIQTALQTLMADRTTFIVAQRLDTVRSADQILVLRDGRIVQRGTHAALLTEDGFYRELYDLQRRERSGANGTDGAVPDGADLSLARPGDLDGTSPDEVSNGRAARDGTRPHKVYARSGEH
ncbi:MAG: ABC transporter ATP-binding protein/permease [Chloroflexota bacterium]|nr:ABC transporter ATP-binding protein/permease [Chloroflexota bacterium]